MCTVTFVNRKDAIILTSNRDEHVLRPSAQSPHRELRGEHHLFFPIDPQGGGTWFVAKDNDTAFVLLNGANERHKHSPPYRKSRGLILLDLAEKEDLPFAWQEIDLDNIEPFTVVAFNQNQLNQLQWNGMQKTSIKLEVTKPYIWSSATLYSSDIRERRKNWFEDFMLKKRNLPDPDELMEFHTMTGHDDKENGLIINRNDLLRTKNVTQCVLSKGGLTMTHWDLIVGSKTVIHHEQ